jgi:hydrogenase maturation protein HypF
MISPDIAICGDCKCEVADSADRRYNYPFTNCTNCGPRFTIIKDVPYDRAKTTMAGFKMCPECQAEYENPLHRRFHAQPNACPICGPHTTLVDKNGQTAQGSVLDYLKEGYIVAVKGLGGFHLAVDATNQGAIASLRQRKRRDAKPFAVMVRNLEAARKYCRVNAAEEELLCSQRAPIVVMDIRDDYNLPGDIIHPGLNTLGVMLPYTPLHYLLFDDDLEILIMTSANISDEPLITSNEQALDKLSSIADYFLLHNRDIYNPCDDSVMRVTPLQTPQFFRRARGYVPLGIRFPSQTEPVLALGGEMKSTFCMTRRGEAFLSQHWGDLNHFLNYRNFLHGIERFKKMLAVDPHVIAHDQHPNYQTTRWAREQSGVKTVAVQHHYAHMASVMAENELNEEVIGLICDGTGWGIDGAVWGCEILKGDYHQYSRLGHLQYAPLPGGDVTVRKPYRMALVYLIEALGEQGAGIADRLLPMLEKPEKEIILNQVQNQRSVLMTSSCGRLFDAVAAVLGICPVNRYEGQAAIELEAAADGRCSGRYDYQVKKNGDMWLMNILPMWPDMISDISKDRPTGEIAYRFHLTLVGMFTVTLNKIREETGLNKVVLSGGVFHNQIVLLQLIRELEKDGFLVYQHQQVPPGDGGISLGQAIIASEVNS